MPGFEANRCDPAALFGEIANACRPGGKTASAKNTERRSREKRGGFENPRGCYPDLDDEALPSVALSVTVRASRTCARVPLCEEN
jgi:hypothetical protein